jgi:hypothetical protein
MHAPPSAPRGGHLHASTPTCKQSSLCTLPLYTYPY